ncbi:MAG TPA: ATP-grasp domain-containing protein [Longimicrobiales bacterium]
MRSAVTPTVLVADGEQRSALATVRSLGRAGYRVFVASHVRRSLAGDSKYVTGTVVTPKPLDDPAGFVETIRQHVIHWSVDVLLPVTDASVLALLPERDRIAAILPFPSADAFTRLCDKDAVAVEAQTLGIGVPGTTRVESAADAAALDFTSMTFPVVLKPLRSVQLVNGKRVKRLVAPYRDADSLQAALRGLANEEYPVLLQERIVGPGVGVFVILHNGELRAAFAHRRIREKPPWGGVSVLRESIALDRELLERSVALLRRFEVEGAAMVEYKIDSRTGQPSIMEINGRLWGSLQLAIDAGVDFPKLIVEAALGIQSAPALSYRRGVRSRWFWGDVDNLLLQLRARDPELANGATRLKCVGDFLRACGPGSRNEVLRFSDPLPAVRETLDWLAALRAN